MSTTLYPNFFIISVLYAMLFASFYGWGTLTLTALKINLQTMRGRFFAAVWMGWAAVLLVMQALHFFLPLDWRVSVLVYGSGLLVGCYKIFVYIRGLLQSKSFSRNDVIRTVIFFCLILLAARWAAFKGMEAIGNYGPGYDSGLYHFNTIRWINSYPIIPGLGNLHGRLAFNQSFFLYAASLNFFPYFPFGHVIADSFLLLLAFADLAWHLYGLTQKQNQDSLHNIFFFVPYLFGLAIVLYLGVSTNISSPTPDIASSLIQTVLYIWFIQIIADIRNQKFAHDRISILFILGTTLITVKLSNLIFVAGMLAACLFYLMPHLLKVSTNRSIYVRVFIFLAVTILVWMSSGVTLSGYPMYPAALGGLHVDWAVPVDKVRFEADSIYSWAREQGRPPSKVLGNWNWLRPWLARTYRIYKAEIVYPIATAAGLGLITLLLALFQKILRRVFLNSIYLLPVAAGLIYWFFTAPDPRFAHTLFLLLVFGAFLICMSCLYELTGNVWGTVLNISIFVILMFYVFPINGLNLMVRFPTYQPIPTSALVEKKTDSGLTVYVPPNGDQCWDSSLPCTPNFVPELRLRVPGKISSGFTQR